MFLLNVFVLKINAFLQADSAWSCGNYQDARHSANVAKLLNIIGFSIGVLVWIITIVIVATSFALNSSGSSQASNRYGSSSSYYNN